MSTYNSRINGAASYVEPYFAAKWDGATAQQAFEEGKQAAIRNLQRDIEAVEVLTFETFKQRCLHESVNADTTRGADHER